MYICMYGMVWYRMVWYGMVCMYGMYGMVCMYDNQHEHIHTHIDLLYNIYFSTHTKTICISMMFNRFSAIPRLCDPPLHPALLLPVAVPALDPKRSRRSDGSSEVESEGMTIGMGKKQHGHD